jgi:hypothetical protein
LKNRELKNLEGKSVKDGRLQLARMGIEDIRISSPEQSITADYKLDRVTLEVDNGIIQKVYRG